MTFQHACSRLTRSAFIISLVSLKGEALIWSQGGGEQGAGQEAKLSKTNRSFGISGENPIRHFFPTFCGAGAEFSLHAMSYELHQLRECAGTKLRNQPVFHFWSDYWLISKNGRLEHVVSTQKGVLLSRSMEMFTLPLLPKIRIIGQISGWWSSA